MARPVQWGTSPGGSGQVSATILATVVGTGGGLPGLRLPAGLGGNDRTSGLGRDRRHAQPAGFVNPVIVSVH